MESAGFASEHGNRAGIVDQRAANRGGENVNSFARPHRGGSGGGVLPD